MKKIFVGLLGTLAFLLLLMTIGIWIDIPGLNFVATILTSLSLWIFLLALALLLCFIYLVVKKFTKVRAFFTVILLVPLVTSGMATAQQLKVAKDNNLDVSLLSSLNIFSSQPESDETYTYYTSETGEELKLSVWKPVNSQDALAPVLFITHGGGWISGDRNQATNARLAERMANKGWLVVSADYSLSTDTEHYWDQIESQLACAMAWTAEHAQSYGASTNRLATSGDSAGGNLALELAYKANNGSLNSVCEGEVPTVDAVAVTYPVADPADFYHNTDAALGPLALDMGAKYTGGSPEEYPNRYQSITPVEQIGENTPPTLTVVGDSDHLVPPEPSYSLAQTLDKKGVENKLIVLPYGEHVFDSFENSLGSQIWLEGAESWLESHV